MFSNSTMYKIPSEPVQELSTCGGVPAAKHLGKIPIESTFYQH